MNPKLIRKDVDIKIVESYIESENENANKFNKSKSLEPKIKTNLSSLKLSTDLDDSKIFRNSSINSKNNLKKSSKLVNLNIGQPFISEENLEIIKRKLDDSVKIDWENYLKKNQNYLNHLQNIIVKYKMLDHIKEKNIYHYQKFKRLKL